MSRILLLVHRLLTRVILPPSFRSEFGEDLAALVDARVRSAGSGRRLAVATLELFDLFRTAAREWWRVGASIVGTISDGARLDARMVVRSMRKSWRTTGLAIVTIAVAIGATTAVYSVIDGVLLRPLAYPDADRLVRVAIGAHPESGTSEGPFSPRGYWHLAENTLAFEAVGAAGVVQRPLAGDGQPVALNVGLMTRSAFEAIGVEPELGRIPSPEEDLPGGPAVAVIGQGLWRDRYAADPAVLGRTIQLGPESYEVIGVMPAGYDFPAPGTDAWIPRQLDPATENFRAHFLTVVARLAPGVTIEDARADTERLIAGFADIGYGPGWFEEIFTGAAVVRPLRDEIVGGAREPLLLVLGTVALLLLVGYTTVANLLLVREEHRRPERALRSALGAGRFHQVRYSLLESGLLSALGAVGGVALAGAGVRALVAMGPAAIPRLDQISINTHVLLFATAISAGGGLFFGMVPAMLGARQVSLRPGAGATPSTRRGRSRIQDSLSVGQVALAVMLLTAAAMMIRTLSELRAIDPGFDPENVMTFRIAPRPDKYPDPEASARFYDRLLEQIRDLPGVTFAGTITHLPLTGGGGIRGATLDDRDGVGFFVRRTTSGYFEAMGIPVIEGRSFVDADHHDRLGSVLISRSVAREFWPLESALGRRIETWGAPARVVGVVGDVHEVDLRGVPDRAIYKPLLDSIGGGGLAQTVVVRTGGDGRGDLTADLRRIVAGIDADLPITEHRPMDAVVGEAMSRTSFTMTLIALAAGIALLLAAIGIYGVLSYVVSQRRREMAVRLTMGADRRDVLALVLVHGMRLAALGLVTGTIGALLLVRGLRFLLSEVGPIDASTLGGVAAVLLTASAAASLAPAIRSARTSPVKALREDA